MPRAAMVVHCFWMAVPPGLATILLWETILGPVVGQSPICMLASKFQMFQVSGAVLVVHVCLGAKQSDVYTNDENECHHNTHWVF